MLWLLLIPVLIYSVTIIAIRLSLSKIRYYRYPPVSEINVSVVVACRNEESSIGYLIRDLLAQDYPEQLTEIIIVDDHSVDNTFSNAAALSSGNRIKLISNRGRGKKDAVKTGVLYSSGELIITTDADCRLKRGWISSFVSYHRSTGSDMITGPVLLSEGKGFFSRFQELEYISLQGITAGTCAMKMPVMCNGSNLAFTRKTYLENSEKIRGDIVSGDDVFLLHSVKKDKGKKIGFLLSEEALVITEGSESVKDFLKQRGRWISKAASYKDFFTKYLGIITFVTIAEITGLLVAACFRADLLSILALLIIMKSIPDYLLVSRTAALYGRKDLMKWFIPSLIIYPFYVGASAVAALTRGNRW